MLLADEPTGNLDSARSEEIMELLTAFNREQGITIVMVTHEPDMAAYAKRIIHFMDGQIESDAAKREDTLMFWNTLLLALREIRRNVLRSFLTMLGIVIGVAAVITMVTLGGGATAQVTDADRQPGQQPADDRPGQTHGPGAVQLPPPLSRWRMPRPSAGRSAAVAAVAPVSTPMASAIYGNENWSTTVTGTDQRLSSRSATGPHERPDLHRQRTPRRGGRLPHRRNRAQEALRQPGPAGQQDPPPQLLFQVIGLLEAKGQTSMGQDQDDVVLIPLRTFQRRIAGNRMSA